MTRKSSRKTLTKLRAETDRLARQATRTKKQLDKVQHAADAVVEKATHAKKAKGESSS